MRPPRHRTCQHNRHVFGESRQLEKLHIKLVRVPHFSLILGEVGLFRCKKKITRGSGPTPSLTFKIGLSMTDRLYYHDSLLYNFDAAVESASETPRPALILDRTAFYPTSGGQLHDTGWITSGADKLRVTEVADTEDGKVIHYLEAPKPLAPGTRILGEIDATRRRDH